MIWILNFICRFLMVRQIFRDDGALYLSRYRIFGWMPGSKRKYPLSIYLHHFHSPDSDEAEHNHPWKWSFSLVLAGGYTEIRFDGDRPESRYVRRLRPFRLNWISHDTYHNVTALHGRESWTLFFAGPKATSWGFWVPGRGHVEWRERLRERGIKIDYEKHEET